MVGKTERITMTSGVAPALSGLVTGLSIDGTGHLRRMKITKCENSGIIRIVVYSDSGLIIDNNTIALASGVASPEIDLIGSSWQTSGATLLSGTPITNANVDFTENLTVRFTCTSGSVNIATLVDMNKRIIQT